MMNALNWFFIGLGVASIGAFGLWIASELSKRDRLDTEEDLRDRERMLDDVERSFYRHAGKRLLRGEPVFSPKDGQP